MRTLFDKLFPAKRYGEGWGERNFGEHWSLGPIVLYGFNAMHVAVNIRTRWGFVCFHPTFRVFGKWWPWYLYISSDGTPNQARFKIGGYGW
jgi:hypothetical protein